MHASFSPTTMGRGFFNSLKWAEYGLNCFHLTALKKIHCASHQILPYFLLPGHLVFPVVLVLYMLLVHLHCPAKVRQQSP